MARNTAERDMDAGAPHEWGSERRGWHLDKTISAGNVLTAIPLLVGVVIWASGMEHRIAEVAARIVQIEEQRKEDMKRQDEYRREMKSDMRTTGDKLDRLLERVSERRP